MTRSTTGRDTGIGTAAPRPAALRRAGYRRLRPVCAGAVVALPLCWARLRHGVVEHGQSEPLGPRGRRAAQGAPGARVHRAVEPETRADRCHADARWPG